MLNNIRLKNLPGDRHSSLLGPFASYEENYVVWVEYHCIAWPVSAVILSWQSVRTTNATAYYAAVSPSSARKRRGKLGADVAFWIQCTLQLFSPPFENQPLHRRATRGFHAERVILNSGDTKRSHLSVPGQGALTKVEVLSSVVDLHTKVVCLEQG